METCFLFLIFDNSMSEQKYHNNNGYHSWLKRYKILRKLADCLQGNLYLGYDTKRDRYVAIKKICQNLVKNKRNKSGIYVNENFIHERTIQIQLSKMDKELNIIPKVYASFDDNKYYYMITELLQSDLYKYTINYHHNAYIEYIHINANLEQQFMLKPNAWLIKVQCIFKQIVYGVEWMHSKNICHLDLSLENVMYIENKRRNNSNNTRIQCKIIDFGLSKIFFDDIFVANNKIGKRRYMAPETYQNKNYDARKADVYCLGIILFIMIFGDYPYNIPNENDLKFKWIINGYLKKYLISYKKLRLIDENAFDLLHKILKWERNRITIDQILKHKFITTKYQQYGMKKFAKNVLTDFGFTKYQDSMTNNGYINLADFDQLCANNGRLLVEKCGYTSDDARMFVYKWTNYTGLYMCTTSIKPL